MSQTSFAGQPVAQILVGLTFLGFSSLVASFGVLRLRSIALGNSQWMQVHTVLVMFTTLLNAWCSYALLFGAGTDNSHRNCNALVIANGVTYGLAKIAHHGFLAERLHLVYTNHRDRYMSPSYWSFSAVAAVVVGVIVFVVYSRTVEIRGPEGHCYGGYGLAPPLVALSLSIVLDMSLSALFVLPVYRAGFQGARKLARKSAIAAIAMLLAVVGEYSYILIIGETARGWILSLVMLADLTFNAVVLFVTTNRSNDRDSVHSSAAFTSRISDTKIGTARRTNPHIVSREWNPTASHAPRTMADLHDVLEAGRKTSDHIPLELDDSMDEERGVFSVRKVVLSNEGDKKVVRSLPFLGEVRVSRFSEVEVESENDMFGEGKD